MAVASSQAGPYFASGSISFSSLRNTFGGAGGPISASQFRRDTNVNNPDPIVPDATENEDISTDANLSLSQFRGSIKYYYITQSGTDEGLSLHDAEWNDNLGRNIVKTAFITGVNGVDTVDVAAVRHRGDTSPTRNLTIQVSGDIFGAGGIGGGREGNTENPVEPISGSRGGGALRVEGSGGGTATINVIITATGRVYAGGGGGERGPNGANGAGGLCPESCTWSDTFCQGNAAGEEKCPGGTRYDNTRWVRCCETQDDGGGCVRALWEVTCCYPAYSTAGGAGGIGGFGGNGRGYDNQTGDLSGAAGAAGGAGGGCGAEAGAAGGAGGSGGDWGSAGEGTANTGDPGSSGPAIFGNNFTLGGTVNATTVRGFVDTDFSGLPHIG